ncbi:unnamed protein product [Protopolystoma xenopodis]|uniref:Uncharacterized protein n=1 Tax=Protopolystoma xenopodis TaxID=117903 RepID=A0A3S5CPJ1_9PLAT|nr:unnamed protein product [Protopolystoma xenopodis]
MYRPSFHPLSDLVSKVNNLIWHTRDLSKLLLPHGLCDQKIEERVFISTTMFCEFFGALPRDEEVNGTLAIRTDQLWRWFKTPPFPELAEGWDCTNRYSCLGHLSTHWAGRPEMLARRFLAIISQFLRVGQLIISALKKHPITASSTDKSDSFRCFLATWLTLSSSVTIFVKLALVHWLWAPIFFEETLESKSGKIFVTPTMDSDFGSKSTLGQSSICFVRKA